jgi:hypothetical protein
MRLTAEIKRKESVDVDDYDRKRCGKDCPHMFGTLAYLKCRLYGIRLSAHDRKRAEQCVREFGEKP